MISVPNMWHTFFFCDLKHSWSGDVLFVMPGNKFLWMWCFQLYRIPWEPKTFIFRGYNPYIGGLKPSFFMVLGSKGIQWLSKNPFRIQIILVLLHQDDWNKNFKHILLGWWFSDDEPHGRKIHLKQMQVGTVCGILFASIWPEWKFWWHPAASHMFKTLQTIDDVFCKVPNCLNWCQDLWPSTL